MKIRSLVLGAAVAASALVTLAAPASAYIACNREGDCWHTEARVARPGVRFDYHPDDYYFHQRWDGDERRHWRSDYHRDRGFYRNGLWVTF